MTHFSFLPVNMPRIINKRDNNEDSYTATSRGGSIPNSSSNTNNNNSSNNNNSNSNIKQNTFSNKSAFIFLWRISIDKFSFFAFFIACVLPFISLCHGAELLFCLKNK